MLNEEMISGLIVPAPGWSEYSPPRLPRRAESNESFVLFRAPGNVREGNDVLAGASRLRYIGSAAD